ncbi:MAG: carbohydrate kinase family protein [Erysipelotrichaceae bacterium]|nr:carbohydrate kinase family protein [Erysipelotrichaceae bacterium]
MSKINVLGASCIDILVEKADRKAFFSGKYKADRIMTSFGGDALNEAVVLKALGNDVSLSTIVGNDPGGHMIAAFLKEKGIDVNGPIFREDIDTYISLVLIDETGERYFVGSQNGSLRLYSLEDVHVDEDCQFVSFASLFISKMLDDEKLTVLFKNIKDRNIILCADTSSIKNNEYALDMKCLSFIDYFFCNESEAKGLCRNDDLFECEEILKKIGVKNVIIKAGEKGCLYEGRFYPPEEKIRCIDSTGAGDSFVAGFLSSLAKGEGIDACLKNANRCGSRACRYVGATAWTADL